jgi:hypothetical protein
MEELMPRLRTLAAGLALSLAAACGSTKTPATDAPPGTADAAPGTPDAMPDAPDGGVPPPPPVPSTQFQTAGGGSTSSASYRAQIRMGAPQPAGTATSAGHGVRLGPTTP